MMVGKPQQTRLGHCSQGLSDMASNKGQVIQISASRRRVPAKFDLKNVTNSILWVARNMLRYVDAGFT